MVRVAEADCRRLNRHQALKDARIAILTCPFEPPKPKTKHKVDIDTVEKFEALRATEQQYFTDMVQKCKDSGEDLDALALMLVLSPFRTTKHRDHLYSLSDGFTNAWWLVGASHWAHQCI